MNISTIYDKVSPEVLPLLKRAFLFLEDNDWKSADQYCERILDIDPENAYAYLGKLLSQLHVTSVEALEHHPQPFDHHPAYQKVIRFADSDLAHQLESWNTGIRSRNEQAQKARKTARAKGTKKILMVVLIVVCVVLLVTQVIMPLNTYMKYRKAVSLMEQGSYEEAIAAFESLGTYKDADSRKSELEKMAAYSYASALMEDEDYRSAKDIFRLLGDYEDSAEKLKSCYIAIHGEDAYNWISSMEIGDVVEYGVFEQDNDRKTTDEPISWQVIEKQGASVLLLSDDILTYRPFHTDYSAKRNTKWEQTDTYKWLNVDFFFSAFSNEEQSLVLLNNPSCHANVFLLSQKEADSLNRSVLEAYNTKYATAQSGDAPSRYWALRTFINVEPKYDGAQVLWINKYGDPPFGTRGESLEDYELLRHGTPCNLRSVGIRPAIWVSLDA